MLRTGGAPSCGIRRADGLLATVRRRPQTRFNEAMRRGECPRPRRPPGSLDVQLQVREPGWSQPRNRITWCEQRLKILGHLQRPKTGSHLLQDRSVRPDRDNSMHRGWTLRSWVGHSNMRTGLARSTRSIQEEASAGSGAVAEIRRMALVEGLSQREICRTVAARKHDPKGDRR